jgi:ACR3 family arsenite transporter
MSAFERYLSLWIALAIVMGILLGSGMPGRVQAIAAAEVARVNHIVAVLI